MTITAPAAAVPSPDTARQAFTALTGEPAEHVSRLPKGHGHLAWLVRSPTGTYLLKSGIRHASASDLHREITAQQIAAVGGVTVPSVVAASARDNPLGRPCYVQTWIEGRDADTALPALTRPGRSAFAGRFGHTVAVLHTVTAPRFAEDCSATRTYPSWQAACHARLSRVTDANRAAALLPPRLLEDITSGLLLRIDALADGIRPALTHRDLYLPNVIDRGTQVPAALIDFESAAFYDPVWDFVKLGMWVFRRHPDLEQPFMSGYTAETPLPADFRQRLTLYQGIEYLAGIPYFGQAWPDPVMLASFRDLLGTWASEALPPPVAS